MCELHSQQTSSSNFIFIKKNVVQETKEHWCTQDTSLYVPVYLIKLRSTYTANVLNRLRIFILPPAKKDIHT